MGEYSESCKRIWDGYKLYASSAKVSRRGFELVGSTNYRGDFYHDMADAFMIRGESSLEHQAKTAWLCSVFASNFLNYFGITETEYVYMDVWFLIISALCHDVGEVEIGDIPDDGNPMHDKKDALELEVFKDLVKAYGIADQMKLIHQFKQFQDKDSPDGKALYVLDKTEAILTNLFLEMHGRVGRISKKHYPTDQDWYFMKCTDSDVVADCWAAHMYSQIQNYPRSIREPALTLVDTAVRDVRGEPFKWWGKEILPYKHS